MTPCACSTPEHVSFVALNDVRKHDSVGRVERASVNTAACYKNDHFCPFYGAANILPTRYFAGGCFRDGLCLRETEESCGARVQGSHVGLELHDEGVCLLEAFFVRCDILFR